MNRFNSLNATINSFFSNHILPNQVVIVDQSNDGKTSSLIKDLIDRDEYKSNCNFIYEHQEYPSSTDARNSGINIATNEILIFSDDDVEVKEDTLANIINIMDDNSISMISAINELEGQTKSKLGYLLGFKSFFKRKIGHVAPAIFGRFPTKIEKETKTEWAMGFFFVVRKSLVDKWGLKWDENLKSYAYAEDLDFSYSYYKKSKEEGLKCIISSDVIVKHLQSQEYRIPSRKTTFMYVLNRAYLYKKHNFGFRYWIMFNIANYSMLTIRRIKKQNPQDMKDAMKYLKKHKKEVFDGKFYYGE